MIGRGGEGEKHTDQGKDEREQKKTKQNTRTV